MFVKDNQAKYLLKYINHDQITLKALFPTWIQKLNLNEPA